MPFLIGDVVKIREDSPYYGQLPGELIITEISSGRSTLDHIYRTHLNQYMYREIDLELIRHRIFQVGDEVECIIPIGSDGNIFPGNGGSGWSPGMRFIINRIDSHRSEDITDKILWSEGRNGVYQSWVKLITPVSSKPKPNYDRFTIGSDIEVAFVKNNQMVGDGQVLIEAFRRQPHFGTDHGGAVGEFRPTFGHHPMEHCANLKKAIREIIEGGWMLPDTKLDSSHILGPNVVGGHIHFGIKDPDLIQKCKKNLDYWLLPTIQPLFPKHVFMKRVQSGYGQMRGDDSQIRSQPHGFEYRLIPSFIFSEKIAQGIFCLAYAIVKLTIEGKLKVRLDEVDSNWIGRFITDYNNYGLNKLNDLREESIKTFLEKNLLGNLNKHIYPLFDAIKNEEKFSGDIAEGWGMKYNYVLNRRSEKTSTIDGALSDYERFLQDLRHAQRYAQRGVFTNGEGISLSPTRQQTRIINPSISPTDTDSMD